MDIHEVYNIVGSFKAMNFKELNVFYSNLSKVQKKNEEHYNNIVEQLFFIMRELQKEMERKLPPQSESDDEPECCSNSDDEIRSYNIRLVDVYSDEE